MNDNEFLDWCEAHETTGLVLNAEQFVRLHMLARGMTPRVRSNAQVLMYRQLGWLARLARKRIAAEVPATLKPQPRYPYNMIIIDDVVWGDDT